MITAQDIRERTFERSRINGYDPVSVDDFLDQLADELAASQKESSVLKQKMKVLVEKIEEYRGNEEALNLAILSAQKLAVQIEKDARARAAATVAEAEQHAAAMIADADAQVKARLGGIEEQAEIERRRLAEAQAATASYFAAVRKLCEGQLGRLDEIQSDFVAEPAEEPAPVAEEPAPVAEEPAPVAEEPASDFDRSPMDDVAAHLGLDSTKTFDF